MKKEGKKGGCLTFVDLVVELVVVKGGEDRGSRHS